MKNNTIIILSAVLALAGCMKEKGAIEQTKVNEKEVVGKEITIHATMEEKDDETKTALDGGAVLWLPGDAISLFYGSGMNGGSQFTSTATEPSNVTNFSGTITAITGGADVSLEDTFFWGVYPYRDDTSCDGSSVTMTLPRQQTAVAGTFATGLFPSLGRSQGLYMGFYNICGGWRFSVTKEGVRKVTLKTNGGEYITGKVKVGLNASGIPVVQEIIDGSDEVVLECPRGEYFEVGQTYYMVLLPGTCASGFTMTFETYTEAGVYNRTASTTITRSKFSGITNIDNYLTTPYAQKTGNIPVEDANFKAYLVSNFDTNGDGEISYTEASTVRNISVCTDNIYSLNGIECFAGLHTLECAGSNFYWNMAEQRDYGSGKLLTLDLSNNREISILKCEKNKLSTLDINISANIMIFSCGINNLTTLDVSHYPNLYGLFCQNNFLATLDVSHNSSLKQLECSDNQLTALDVSQNADLGMLYCSGNQLESLDVSHNAELTSLSCYHNQLTSIDVSQNTELDFLMCGGNPLTSIDISANALLRSFDCNSCQIASLNVSNNSLLSQLSCSSNQLTSLDVSNNTELVDLWCQDNQLTSLNLSANTALQSLYCYDKQITTLDVSKNTALTSLDCSPMASLETLKIAQGQEIPSVTVNRNEKYIPAQTQIVIAPVNGGNEGAGDEEVTP
jgi:hypothetical protein